MIQMRPDEEVRAKALELSINLHGKNMSANHPTRIVETADKFEDYINNGRDEELKQAPPGYESVGPQAFTDERNTVINYKGVNFYAACDSLVKILPEGKTHCIKPIDHANKDHEDYLGNLRSN